MSKRRLRYGIVVWTGKREWKFGPEAHRVQGLIRVAARIVHRAHTTAPAPRFIHAPPKTINEKLVDAIQETTLNGDAMTGRNPEGQIADRIFERFDIKERDHDG